MLARFGRPPETPMEFLELLVASGAHGWRDPQVRYFSSIGSLEAARTTIEDLDVITATMNRLDLFAKETSERLGLRQLMIGHQNKGLSRARSNKLKCSAGDADAIRRYFPNDQKLYDYIAEKCAA